VVHALGPLDLDVGPGEMVVVLGPSGCGKTTLLRILAGLLTSSTGEIRHGDPHQGSLNGTGFSVGMVFQDSNLLPWLTVDENVALPLRLRGVGRRERLARAAELCRLVGIDGFEQFRADQLSIGMRQRAATGRALCGEPDLLLLDEPFAALDALTREQMNLELQRIWLARPCMAVMVTHSISEAVFLADRVVSLSRRPGRVVAVTDIPLPRPRSLEMQTTPAFQDLVARLRRSLEERE